MIGYSVCSGMRPSFYIPSPPFACSVQSVACCKILRSTEKTDCRAGRTEQSSNKQEGELRNMASSTHLLLERGQKKKKVTTTAMKANMIYFFFYFFFQGYGDGRNYDRPTECREDVFVKSFSCEFLFSSSRPR